MSIYIDSDNIELVTDDKKLVDMAIKIADINNKVSNLKTSAIDVLFWCGIVHYVWSSWGYARSAHGSNEREYADLRLKQCERCMKLVYKLRERDVIND